MILSHRAIIAAIVRSLSSGIVGACFLTFVLVLARLVVRRQIPAVLLTAIVALGTVGVAGPGEVPNVTEMIFEALKTMIALGILLRYGLLALAVLTMVNDGGRQVLMTNDWSAWHAQPALTAMVFFAAVAAYAYWTATAGRRLDPAEERRP